MLNLKKMLHVKSWSLDKVKRLVRENGMSGCVDYAFMHYLHNCKDRRQNQVYITKFIGIKTSQLNQS